MRRAFSLVVCGLLGTLGGAGCIADAYLPTCQIVDLSVTSRIAGQPVEAATVTYVQKTGQSEASALSDDALLGEYGRVGGVTNEGGRVSIELDTSRIVGGSALWLGGYNPKSDQVTGRSFIFKVSADHFTDITVSTMREGMEVAGSHVTLRVERIGPARERSKHSVASTE